ncbi:hypothetical protein C0J52_23514 [Blattella germanica]|nr:hypothetical protein C0J52_23514 [Blattella germanica]
MNHSANAVLEGVDSAIELRQWELIHRRFVISSFSGPRVMPRQIRHTRYSRIK